MAAGALLGELCFSGSRLSTGAPNETGALWCYLPNTISPAPLYTDADLSAIATQPITLDNGGRIPYDTYPNGLWVAQPVRLLVQDSAGSTVSDATFSPATADNVSVGNDGFTGTTIDQVLDAAFASTGGQDFQYQESGGATPRPIQDKFREIWLSVKDFGAVGNGIAIDTTAIQTTLNRAKALINGSTNLGGINVFFPAGEYIIDQALTLTSGHGISLIGQGFGSTMIQTTHSTANAFTLTSCASFNITGLRIKAASANSASGISLTDCTDVLLSGLLLDGQVFLIPVNMSKSSGNSSGLTVERCSFQCQDDASGRALKLSSTGFVYIRSTTLAGASGDALELAGTTSTVTVADSNLTGTGKGILWTSGMTGTFFTIYGCPSLGSGSFATPLDLSALSSDPKLYQWGNGITGGTYSAAIGNTLTIKWSEGPNALLVAASGGAGTQTVAAPVPAPFYQAIYTTRFKNGSGGAVTWSLNAIFKLAGAAAPASTDGHTINIMWIFDGTNYRELGRGDTVT
jgi:hypothetical protein